MKAFTHYFIRVAFFSFFGICEAQQATTSQTSVPAPTPYSSVACDGNSSIWESTQYQPGPNGQIIPVTHSFTELATGLNFRDPGTGQWVPSKEEIDILPDGTAAAEYGQHKVSFPGDIYQGVIQMVTPDGLQLQSRPTALMLDDGTNTVIVAVLTNSTGQLLSSNQVIYPNAFDGLNADLVYEYTKAGFEQDILIRQQPPAPESLGLNPATTRLQVLTEFFNPPQPALTTAPLPNQGGLALNDETLDFGVMIMMPGRAFLLGTNAQNPEVSVAKSWITINDRQFLVEEVPLAALADQLATLPTAQVAQKANALPTIASHELQLPSQHLAKTSPFAHSAQLSRNDLRSKGVVLDYVIMSSQTNYTFRGDRTYYLSGTVNLSGTNTFEGGSVLKYGHNATLNFTGTGWQVNSLTSAYRPVIFTSTNDNSVGEIISGSSGNPTQCASTALEFNNYSGAGTTTLSNFCIRWAQTAIQSSAALSLYNGQIVNCQFGYYCNSSGGVSVNLRNMLFAQLSADFSSDGNLSVNAQNVTFSGAGDFTYVGNGDSYYLANCILANITYLVAGGYGDTFTTNGYFNGFYNSSEIGLDAITNTFYPFQTVGAGDYYLTNGCHFINQGVLGYDDSVLQAELGSKTVYPPMVYSNVTITANTNFSPQVQRDTSLTPSLGYHYDPVDFIVNGLLVTNSTLYITNGAALATYNGPGIQIENGGSVVSIGTPTAPNWLVRYQNVQEQSIALGSTNVSSGITISATNGAGSGTFQFTKFSMPENGGYHFYDDGSSVFTNLLVQDSELYDGTNDFSGGSSSSVALLNDLFQRSSLYASNTSSSANLALSNSLAWGTFVTLSQPSGGTWYAFNNDFDSTVITNSTLTNGYNAYLNCTNYLIPTNATDIFQANSLAYQPSFLGNFYQPTNSPLIQMGSTTADLAGLFYFTTQTNQTFEGFSTVDIGYHYVAVNTNGLPFLNQFGIPDYLGSEYTNITSGDGISDAWEEWLGLNPEINNSNTSSERANYSYTLSDWLNGVSGVKTGSINPDNEGNILTVSQ